MHEHPQLLHTPSTTHLPAFTRPGAYVRQLPTALTKFGNDNNIEVIIDRETGDIKIQKVLDIVENVEDSAREITLKDAQKNFPKNKDLKVGEKIFEELPQIDFGRIAAQSAKQVISSRVREAEKNRQYDL